MNETDAKANAMWDTLANLGLVGLRGGEQYSRTMIDASRVIDFAAAADRLAEAVAWIEDEAARS